jgi:hypothetical protein
MDGNRTWLGVGGCHRLTPTQQTLVEQEMSTNSLGPGLAQYTPLGPGLAQYTLSESSEHMII